MKKFSQVFALFLGVSTLILQGSQGCDELAREKAIASIESAQLGLPFEPHTAQTPLIDPHQDLYVPRDQAMSAQDAEKEPERQRAIAAVAKELGQSLSQLPKNKPRIGHEQEQFAEKCARILPEELEREIGLCLVQHNQPMRAFVEKHMRELIPSIVHKHKGGYPSMRQIVDEVTNVLCAKYVESHIYSNKPTYILAVCGFWSYGDEDTKNRCECIDRVRREDVNGFTVADLNNTLYTDDVTLFLKSKYSDAELMPLQHDEFMAVLYSDGTIKWRVSNLGKKLLMNRYTHELEMCIGLFNQPNYMHKNAWNDCPQQLPIVMKEAIKSNYALSAHKNVFLTKKALAIGLKYASIASWLGLMGLSGYRVITEIARGKKQSTVEKFVSAGLGAALGEILITIEKKINKIPLYIGEPGRGACIFVNPRSQFWRDNVKLFSRCLLAGNVSLAIGFSIGALTAKTVKC